MKTEVTKRSQWTIARQVAVTVGSGGIALIFFVAVYYMVKDWDVHLGHMHEQVFNDWWSDIVAWVLAILYALVGAVLSYRTTRRAGLWVALGYMVVLTTYIILAMTKAFGFYPCSCIGFVADGTFQDNLRFNGKLLATILLTIALDRRWLVKIGVYLSIHRKRWGKEGSPAV